ncbi:lysylphosphatidylglycerol synthase domain-containing protein [Endothiovibrio diazotrophicus]
MVAAAIIWLIRDQFEPKHFRLLLEQPLIALVVPLSWILNQLATGIRLAHLLRCVAPVKAQSEILRANFISLFVGTAVPGFAADVVKLFYLKRACPSLGKTEIAVLLILDRLLGLLAILFFAALSSLWLLPGMEGRNRLLLLVPIGLLLLFFASIGLSGGVAKAISGRVSRSRFQRALQVVRQVARRENLPLLGKVLLWNLAAVFVLIFGLTLAGGYLHETFQGEAHYALQFLLIPVSLIVAMIPLTPLGIGVTQVSLGVLYGGFSLAAQVGVSVSSLSQIGYLVVALSIGVPLFIGYRRRIEEESKAS